MKATKTYPQAIHPPQTPLRRLLHSITPEPRDSPRQATYHHCGVTQTFSTGVAPRSTGGCVKGLLNHISRVDVDGFTAEKFGEVGQEYYVCACLERRGARGGWDGVEGVRRGGWPMDNHEIELGHH